MRSYFPPPPFRSRFIRRTALLWLFLRFATVMGGATMLTLFADLEGGPRPVFVPVGSLLIAAMVAGIVMVLTIGEMVRRSEVMFLANLGWSIRQLAVGALVICVVLEAAVQIAVAW